MIISKKRFQKLVDEEVWKALQRRDKEEELCHRFRHIEDRLDSLANAVYTRATASNTPTNG